MRLHNSATALVAEQAWSALGFEIVEHVRRRPLDAAGAAGVAHAAVASADPHPATR
jgi:hypothetical protein